MARILIIEDDNEVREYLESVLSRAGYDVISASNGKEGSRGLFEQGPRGRPGDHRHHHAREGRHRDHHGPAPQPYAGLKVIAISGGGRAEPENYLHSARLLGANRTMKKPFTNQEMLDSHQAELLG